MLILTSATAITLPITLISGLLGMNIGGLPFKTDRAGFRVVLLFSLLLTVAATGLIFRLTRG